MKALWHRVLRHSQTRWRMRSSGNYLETFTQVTCSCGQQWTTW